MSAPKTRDDWQALAASLTFETRAFIKAGTPRAGLVSFVYDIYNTYSYCIAFRRGGE